MLTEKDVKAFCKNLEKFSVMTHRAKLSSGNRLEVVKNYKGTTLKFSHMLLDIHTYLTIGGYFDISKVSNETLTNIINTEICQNILCVLVKRKEFSEGYLALSKNEPTHPYVTIISQFMYSGMVDINDDNFIELWNDITTGVFL